MQAITKFERGNGADVYQPPRVKSSPVFQQAIMDLDFIAELLRRSQCVREAFLFSRSMRTTREEMAEIILSCAATASLIEYRRDTPWRLDIVKENSSYGIVLLRYVHELRSQFLRLESSFAREMTKQHFKPFFKASLALCALSLDAVSPENTEKFLVSAGLGAGSNDPVGDAQFDAEELDRTGLLPFSNIASRAQ